MPSAKLSGLINNISNMVPPSPLLTQLSDVSPDMFCNTCEEEFCECTHLIKVPLGAVVEFVIADSCKCSEGVEKLRGYISKDEHISTHLWSSAVITGFTCCQCRFKLMIVHGRQLVCLFLLSLKEKSRSMSSVVQYQTQNLDDRC